MNFKYHKGYSTNTQIKLKNGVYHVEEECAHCFLKQICNKPQNIAYRDLRPNSKKFKEYLDKIITHGEESEYLCEDYIEFRKYADECDKKAYNYIKLNSTGNETIDNALKTIYAIAYNEGFKRALDVTINHNDLENYNIS